MKKLVFSALLAIVAVGGALTTNATTYYSSSRSYDCSLTRFECSSIPETIYDNPQLQGDPVPKAPLAGTFYN